MMVLGLLHAWCSDFHNGTTINPIIHLPVIPEWHALAGPLDQFSWHSPGCVYSGFVSWLPGGHLW